MTTTTMTTNGDGFLQPRPTPLARSLARYGAICSCIVTRQFVPPSLGPSVSQDSVERPIIMPLSAVTTTTSTATAAATVARPVSAVAMAKNGVCVDIWVRSQVHRRRRCRAPVATDAAENTCW